MKRWIKTIMIVAVSYMCVMTIQSHAKMNSMKVMGNEFNIINNINCEPIKLISDEEKEDIHIYGGYSFNEVEPLVLQVSEDKYHIELILYKAFEIDSEVDASQLIAEFEIVDMNGRQIDTFMNNQEGIGIWQGSLEKGSYVIREINTASGYMIDERSFGFKVMGKSNELHLINEGEVIVNRLFRFSLKVHLSDETGMSLSDAEFSLYDENFEFIDKGLSDVNGNIDFNNLRAGVYYLKETQYPEGYVLDEPLSRIELFEDSELTLINQKDERMKVHPKTGVVVIENNYEDVLFAVVLASILLLIIIGYKRYKI